MSHALSKISPKQLIKHDLLPELKTVRVAPERYERVRRFASSIMSSEGLKRRGYEALAPHLSHRTISPINENI